MTSRCCCMPMIWYCCHKESRHCKKAYTGDQWTRIQCSQNKIHKIQSRRKQTFLLVALTNWIVNSYKYLGLTLQMMEKTFAKHMEERCTAAIKTMFEIRISVCLELFYIRNAPNACYAVILHLPPESVMQWALSLISLL